MNKYAGVLISIVLIISCGIHKTLHIETNTKKVRNSEDLIKEIEKAKKLPKHLILNTKINIKKEKKTQNIISKIEIKKDSFIVASIQDPFIGIEMFKAKLTPDSLYYINHLKNEWSVWPHQYLKDYLQTEISFSEIQGILLAEIQIPKEEYTFLSKKENYTITNKRQDKKYEIDKKTLKISTVNIERENKQIHVKFFSYKNEELNSGLRNMYLFPKRGTIKFTGIESVIVEINYLYLKVSPSLFGGAKNSSFQIPKDYAEIK